MRGDMSVGTRWAYREKPYTAGTPAIEAEVIKHGPPKSNQVRVRWCSGEWEGLEEWVSKNRLVVNWHELEAKDRDDFALIHLKNAGYEQEGAVPDDAAEEVSGMIPGALQYWSYTHGLIHSRSFPEIEDELQLSRGRLLEFPGAFVDRHGEFYGPPECKIFVARRICELHQEEVLQSVTRRLEELDEKAIWGGYPGWRNASYYEAEEWAEWRRKELPRLELIRHWCGLETAERRDEIAALRREVARLRKVVQDAAEALRMEGRGHLYRKLLVEIGEASPVKTRRVGPALPAVGERWAVNDDHWSGRKIAQVEVTDAAPGRVCGREVLDDRSDQRDRVWDSQQFVCKWEDLDEKQRTVWHASFDEARRRMEEWLGEADTVK